MINTIKNLFGGKRKKATRTTNRRVHAKMRLTKSFKHLATKKQGRHTLSRTSDGKAVQTKHNRRHTRVRTFVKHPELYCEIMAMSERKRKKLAIYSWLPYIGAKLQSLGLVDENNQLVTHSL